MNIIGLKYVKNDSENKITFGGDVIYKLYNDKNESTNEITLIEKIKYNNDQFNCYVIKCNNSENCGIGENKSFEYYYIGNCKYDENGIMYINNKSLLLKNFSYDPVDVNLNYEKDYFIIGTFKNCNLINEEDYIVIPIIPENFLLCKEFNIIIVLK